MKPMPIQTQSHGMCFLGLLAATGTVVAVSGISGASSVASLRHCCSSIGFGVYLFWCGFYLIFITGLLTAASTSRNYTLATPVCTSILFSNLPLVVTTCG